MARCRCSGMVEISYRTSDEGSISRIGPGHPEYRAGKPMWNACYGMKLEIERLREVRKNLRKSKLVELHTDD